MVLKAGLKKPGYKTGLTEMNPRQLEILKLLAPGEPISGEVLGEALGISRNAVWKHLSQFRQLGLEIQAIPGSGYQLSRPLELLDKASILQSLSNSGQTLPGDLLIKDSTGSTNDDLLKLALDQQHGCLILAEHQTAGRGRRGRSWVSPFGRNIYLSLGWKFDNSVSQLAGLSLLAGLVVVEVLATFGVSDARLKWPNDILRIKGKGFAKLGGCLVEIQGDIAGPCQVCIGIGLNFELPEGTQLDQEWIDLSDHQHLSRNKIIAEIILKLLQVLPQFSTSGLAAFTARWNALHAFADRQIIINSGNTRHQGLAKGIDEQGALLLECHTGLKKIHSGELSLQ